MSFVNIAAYKFVTLSELASLKVALKEKCQQLKLKGTILLSVEGINLMLSGAADNIQTFKTCLAGDAHFIDMLYKESLSQKQPFQRMLVKIKKEVITLGNPVIRPDKMQRAAAIQAQELKAWLEAQRDFILLDTRNAYEIEHGSFQKAIHLGIKHFRDFPDAMDQLDESAKQKPVVMFCTGGIRCEKAALVMQAKGFQEVYQLEGGVLQYFAECGGAHYQGDCFVFDDRIAVNAKLEDAAI